MEEYMVTATSGTPKMQNTEVIPGRPPRGALKYPAQRNSDIIL